MLLRPRPPISVELGVTVFMIASVATPGTPTGLQLRGLNQPLETAPVQLDWACVGAVDAASSAMVASNPAETNLQAARARDVMSVMSRRGRMGDNGRGSHPMISPYQPARLGLYRRPQVANKEGSQS